MIPNASAPTATSASPAAPAAPHVAANVWFGLYVPGSPESMGPVKASESRVARHAKVVNFFVADSESFPAPRCANIVAHGSTPLITLEFWSIGSAGLGAITDGSKDAYIRRFADNARAFHKEIWLRPLHEMNARHYPWAQQGSNTPAKFIAAYRHIHDIFVAEGATNVKFVWCPNISYNIPNYYPGNAYVDYAAIDGYNDGKPWRSFSSLFGTTYDAVAAVTPKPIFIAETACAKGPAKAAWITDMFDQIATTYSRISGVCWFDMNKEQDWRMNSSASSITAVKAALAGS
jgi:beta-mannanase